MTCLPWVPHLALTRVLVCLVDFEEWLKRDFPQSWVPNFSRSPVYEVQCSVYWSGVLAMRVQHSQVCVLGHLFTHSLCCLYMWSA